MRFAHLVGFGLLAALGACDREPRSQSFFAGNEAARSEVLADCQVGTHRGQECHLASLAADKVSAQQRRGRRHQELQEIYRSEPASK